MKMGLVRAPLVLGSVIAGAFLLLALLALLTSNPRWDDHLINAIGVFAGGLVISGILWLVTGVFRPRLEAPRRARIIKVVSLIALLLLGFVVYQVAMFFNDMSFL